MGQTIIQITKNKREPRVENFSDISYVIIKFWLNANKSYSCVFVYQSTIALLNITFKMFSLRNTIKFIKLKCIRAKHSNIDVSEISIESIKAEFAKYTGGSVELNKDLNTKIATITLSNPERRNAISGEMMCQLSDVVNDLETWHDGKGLILKSADGNFFCSGGDLTTVKQISNPLAGAKMTKLMHNTMGKLSNLPLISVALVRGRAIGEQII